MAKIEFFITKAQGGFALLDGHGCRLVDALFATEVAAADLAVRFAQDAGALYAIYY